MISFPRDDIETRPFIGGRYVDPVTADLIQKISPIDGSSLSALHGCQAQDLERAVADAGQAFRNGCWRDQPKEARKAVLIRLAGLIEADIERLALLDAVETGRPYTNFLEDSIPKAVDALRWFSEAIDKHPDHSGAPSAEQLSIISREPLGVVGIITPWNDPLVVAMWKLAPALLMGNSVIMKPAEQSSYSMIRVAGLAKQAGLPDGVLNVLPGRGEVIGHAMAMHMEIRGIFFTGSSAVGKEILRCAGASNMKKIGLECGGKSAFIVSKNCRDLKTAAAKMARSMFYNQGQICSAPSRALLQHEIKDEFLAHLAAELPNYLPGHPLQPETRVGALCGREQLATVTRYIRHGMARGYRMLTVPMNAPHPDGCYVAPTIFVDVPPDDILAREEIFGPVLVTHSFQLLDEAIALANSTPYGLAASIWSNDLDEALWCSRRLEAGIVHVNSYGDDDNSAPFGGVKESGLGRDKSTWAFDDYSTLKTTWIQFKARTP